MMEEYLKKYGIEKPARIEFSKRNLVIGKNGSGKTRFLKAYRDACQKDKKDIMYMYFPALAAKYEMEFEEVDVEIELYDIVNNADDMAFDDFVKTFQYTGVSLVEKFITELNARGRRAKERAQSSIVRVQENMKDFLHMELSIDQSKQTAIIKFSDGREKELKTALLEMSPGEINLFYISLFLAVTSNERKYILIMDEPEVHVHPAVLIQFYKKLKELKCMEEIWIATHSPLLLQEFKFEEIILIADGKIQARNSHLYENVMKEMLGEEQKSISELFRSIDEWDFCNFLAECFVSPTVVSEANKSDEQAVKFEEYCQSLKHRRLHILDWGGGSGRLGKCMQLIEAGENKKLEYEYDIYEPYVEDPERDERFNTYKKFEDIKKKYNCVVLMNALHEIGVEEWVSLFKKIAHCLRSDGVLVFAEAKALSIGEQPYCKNGYIVLGENQVKLLFKQEGYDSNIMSFHVDFGKKEKSEFLIIPAGELFNISVDNVKAALESLAAETFINLKDMDDERIRCAEAKTKPSFTYRKYAFMAQQYINVTMVLYKHFSETVKVKEAPKRRESCIEPDYERRSGSRNPHSFRRE